MRKIAKHIFSIFLSFFLFSYAHASVSKCDPTLDTLPLAFTVIPTYPTNIAIGETIDFDYTLTNNSSRFTMSVTSSLMGTPADQATIVVGANDCSIGTVSPGGTCHLTVQVSPTSTGATSYVLGANYTVSGDPSCIEDATSPISFNAVPAANYAYIPNQDGNSITVCDNTGASGLDNCIDTGATGLTAPAAIEILPASSAFSSFMSVFNIAYITNAGDNTVTRCSIDVADGTFDLCGDSGASNIFNEPLGLAFDTSDFLYGYVVNSNNADITKCRVGTTDGAFSACTDAVEILSSPNGIAIQTFGGTDYAYIANAASGTITQCTVNSGTGALELCEDSGLGAVFSFPVSIGFFTSADTYAYVSDTAEGGSGGVWQCDVNTSTGVLSSCSFFSDPAISGPKGITFAEEDTDNYLYVGDGGTDQAAACIIDFATGNLTSCAAYFLYSSDVVSDMVPQTFDSIDYLYTTEPNTGAVLQCKISDEVGRVYCIEAGTGLPFLSPVSITFNVNADTNTYAYVPDPGSNLVWVCDVNITTGQLSACVDSGGVLLSSFDMAFVTVNAVPYAYVSDNSATVWQCQVASGGALSLCIDAGTPLGTPPYAVPTGLSFQLFGGVDYIYVSDSTNDAVYQCALDNTTGLFTACPDSGAGAVFDMPTFTTFQEVTSVLYAYISNSNTSGALTMGQCTVDTSTGLFSACTASTLPNAPVGATFETVDATLYAYIALDDVATGSINRCNVLPDGGLNLCGPPFGAPSSVEISSIDSGTNQVLYVTENGGSGVLGCLIDTTDGSIVFCQDAGTGFMFDAPTDITFLSVSGNNYAYITDSILGTVTQCLQNNATGILSSCVDSGATFSLPTAITFDTLSGPVIYAYVLDLNGNIAEQCLVDDITGLFSGCTSTATLLDHPLAIVFNGDFAYISDQNLNRVLMCQKSSSGLLILCVDSGAGNVFVAPAGVALFTDTEADLNMYVTNLGTNSVTFCLVDAMTGLVNSASCADSGVAGAFALPAGLKFEPFMGTSYAYVPNIAAADPLSNTVSQCTLNADGSFNACADSGATLLNKPFSITFFNP